MAIQIERQVGFLTVRADGALVDREVGELRLRLDTVAREVEAGHEDITHVVIDLAAAARVSRMALASLVGFLHWMRMCGRDAVVVAPSEEVIRYIKECGLDGLVKIAATEPAAFERMVKSTRREYSREFLAFLIQSQYITRDQLATILAQREAQEPGTSLETPLMASRIISWKTMFIARHLFIRRKARGAAPATDGAVAAGGGAGSATGEGMPDAAPGAGGGPAGGAGRAGVAGAGRASGGLGAGASTGGADDTGAGANASPGPSPSAGGGEHGAGSGRVGADAPVGASDRGRMGPGVGGIAGSQGAQPGAAAGPGALAGAGLAAGQQSFGGAGAPMPAPASTGAVGAAGPGPAGAGAMTSVDPLGTRPGQVRAVNAMATSPGAVRPAGPTSEFVTRSLMGELLVELGVISSDQLRKALEEQRRAGEGSRLGDVLVRLGFVSDEEIFTVLEKQYERRGAKGPRPDGTSPGAVHPPKLAKPGGSEFVKKSLLGEILLELGVVDADALRRALDEQRRATTPEKLGAILLRLGIVTRDQIFMALETQARRKSRR